MDFKLCIFIMAFFVLSCVLSASSVNAGHVHCYYVRRHGRKYKHCDQHHDDRQDHRHDKHRGHHRGRHHHDNGNHNQAQTVSLSDRFFKYLSALPFNVYDNYMCSLMAMPTRPHCHRRINYKCGLGLGSLGRQNKDFRLENLISFLISHNVMKIRQDNTHRWANGRSRWHGPFARTELSSAVVLQKTRDLLMMYNRLKSHDLQILGDILQRDLSTCQIAELIRLIFRCGSCLRAAIKAAHDVKMFYVTNQESTSKNLFEPDLRRLMINMVLSSSGLNKSIRYHKHMTLMNEMRNRLVERILPYGYDRRAISNIKSILFALRGRNHNRDYCHRVLDDHVSSKFVLVD